jgi:hypothetical protein
MDDFGRAYYEQAFKAKFLEEKGTSFQDFFADIMGKRYPADFQRVRPWGRRGDQKNDGYLKSKRILFQVYAPNDMTEKDAIDKIEEDFSGALPHWKKYFDTWVFVHNSRQGLGPEQSKKLLELDMNHKEITVTQWGFDEIRGEIFQLNETDLAAVLGPAPGREDVLNITAAQLATVLDSLPRCDPPPDLEIRPVSEGKIKANELSDSAACLLKAGMEGAPKVDWYFQNSPDKTLGDRIAQGLRSEYEDLRGQGLNPDEIFGKLHGTVRSSSDGTPKQEATALAVLSYFFEECDFFEDSGAI